MTTVSSFKEAVENSRVEAQRIRELGEKKKALEAEEELLLERIFGGKEGSELELELELEVTALKMGLESVIEKELLWARAVEDMSLGIHKLAEASIITAAIINKSVEVQIEQGLGLAFENGDLATARDLIEAAYNRYKMVMVRNLSQARLVMIRYACLYLCWRPSRWPDLSVVH